MTTSRRRDSRHTGPRDTLRRRFLAAFLVAVLLVVAAMVAAALVGTDRGLTAAQDGERTAVAERVAAAAAQAYAAAGGWDSADLSAAEAIASGAGARLVVRDTTGSVVISSPHGVGLGPAGPAGPTGAAVGPGGQGTTSGQGTTGGQGPPAGAGVGEPVVVDGTVVGSVRLWFGSEQTTGRSVAWTWIVLAAVVAVIVALVGATWMGRWVARPVVDLADRARRFGAGDRAALAGTDAPGEIGDLSRALAEMGAAVDGAEQLRRRMAADLAHEIRTPLAALQAGLEELRDGLAEPDEVALGRLHDQSLRLGRVVEDLSRLSAAEANEPQLVRWDLDLGETVLAAATAAEPELRAAGLELRTAISSSVLVRADGDRVHQVVGNLLANAARYCRSGDVVTVEVRREGHEGVIVVADTGPGISASDLPHVLERFYRGDSGRDVPGSGVGLAIAAALARAHGGRVVVDSDGRSGTTVTVRLPAGPVPPRSDPRRSGAGPAGLRAGG